MVVVDKGLLAPVRAGVPVERLVSDDAWLEAMVEVELALARAQARLGIIPAEAVGRISTAVREHRWDTRAIAEAARGAANPVVAFVQQLHRAVAEVDPTAADQVHWGSTSQDILDTATMLIAARALSAIIADVEATVDALGRLAREHRDTPVAARTLGMHAVPTTFGARVAVWMQGLLDARDRLRRVRDHGLPVQLGGAAGTSASYVECARGSGGELATAPAAQIYTRLSDEFAAELSLAPIDAPWHSVRTPIADLAAVLALTSGALGKFAVDVIAQSRTEVREVAEPGAAGRGESSAMPQKRNPVLSTLIRAAALQVPALSSTLYAAMLAEDERSPGAWHAEWQPLRECLLLVGGSAHTAAELAAGLTADSGRMGRVLALSRGQVVSERLSIRLIPLLGRTEAKKALQSAAFEAEARGRSLAEVLAENPAVRRHFDPDQLARLLRPEEYLGVAPDLVDRVLGRA
ncbi:3-carboxy-cis,cis-muconate cycloisomerase [Nocardia sp. CDC159]|uniref:3-carboxy-cis,cis-muconate cycloisomerase n=1 Tax=Nocardia pulmonis TaxID=2951408 RepID=A0A9X2IV57_9NOCA|nr:MULTISPECIES: 3-carboxy-cis,cis-muconate cycloisomerase [Nocardia]MCM6773542.1 3-carboxy-cis,cis-muconate cycloisomerase [Nocardia pulmonis]MCM6786429.1 3-carboxy-cis,cis-muconate cycloisomerase [Nocardia sp. CDC159]